MTSFTLTKSGRTLLMLTTVFAVGAVFWIGCGKDDNPSGGGNNTFVKNTCTSAGSCKTVVIGSQTWMAENLNIASGNSWCYDDKPDGCKKYGRLYDWETAKTVCPTGWKLPDTSDWNKLVREVGDTVAGTKLKSARGWRDDWNGTDDYGFSALPGGGRFLYCEHGFDDEECEWYFDDAVGYGEWWTATEYHLDSERRAWQWYLSFVESGGLTHDDKSFGLSVRCVLDVD